LRIFNGLRVVKRGFFIFPKFFRVFRPAKCTISLNRKISNTLFRLLATVFCDAVSPRNPRVHGGAPARPHAAGRRSQAAQTIRLDLPDDAPGAQRAIVAELLKWRVQKLMLAA
jgi:hypothetical protein